MKHSLLTTNRFILKALTPDIVSEEYLSWFSGKEVAANIDYASNELSMEKLRNYVREKYEQDDVFFFGIFLKENLRHIGNIKFEPVNLIQKFTVLGVLIGDRNWQGQGVFGEISQVLEKGFVELGIQRIYLGVHSDNQAAIKAYQKNGYQIDVSNFLGSNLSNSVCMVKEIS